jgi:hypothetical protein
MQWNDVLAPAMKVRAYRQRDCQMIRDGHGFSTIDGIDGDADSARAITQRA